MPSYRSGTIAMFESRTKELARQPSLRTVGRAAPNPSGAMILAFVIERQKLGKSFHVSSVIARIRGISQQPGTVAVEAGYRKQAIPGTDPAQARLLR